MELRKLTLWLAILIRLAGGCTPYYVHTYIAFPALAVQYIAISSLAFYRSGFKAIGLRILLLQYHALYTANQTLQLRKHELNSISRSFGLNSAKADTASVWIVILRRTKYVSSDPYLPRLHLAPGFIKALCNKAVCRRWFWNPHHNHGA